MLYAKVQLLGCAERDRSRAPSHTIYSTHSRDVCCEQYIYVYYMVYSHAHMTLQILRLLLQLHHRVHIRAQYMCTTYAGCTFQSACGCLRPRVCLPTHTHTHMRRTHVHIYMLVYINYTATIMLKRVWCIVIDASREHLIA